jgi:indolepyruvate ferredoxin oxidoreductase alpha subunit
VHNPTRWEVRIGTLRARIIGWLQSRRAARRLTFGGAA